MNYRLLKVFKKISVLIETYSRMCKHCLKEIPDFDKLLSGRLVGGIRASLYNAVKIEEAQVLSNFMKDFQKAHT